MDIETIRKLKEEARKKTEKIINDFLSMYENMKPEPPINAKNVIEYNPHKKARILTDNSYYDVGTIVDVFYYWECEEDSIVYKIYSCQDMRSGLIQDMSEDEIEILEDN